MSEAAKYINRLRRAFLLRVHPDRFRSSAEPGFLEEQAKFVSSLGSRLEEEDLRLYGERPWGGGSPPRQYGRHSFSIAAIAATKDGSAQRRCSLDLDLAAYALLRDVSSLIKFAPPPEPERPKAPPSDRSASDCVGDFVRSHTQHQSPTHRSQDSRGSLNRNLLHFLRTLPPDEITRRKMSRIDAHSAATAVRQSFGFASCDGTGLGWSSSSLAVCLLRLVETGEEHSASLRDSFYPFRLVLSAADERIDLYGGDVVLNPSSTPLQWLKTLGKVSDESVRLLKRNREALRANQAVLEDALGSKVVKGLTCTAREFHSVVFRLAAEAISSSRTVGDDDSSLAQTGRSRIVVESSRACRRMRLRSSGDIEVGAGDTNLSALHAGLARLRTRSVEATRAEEERRIRCMNSARRVMEAYAVQKVRRSGRVVTHGQMQDCLETLLRRDDRADLRDFLAGHALVITTGGKLCHVADDGAIVVPVDCC
ncbi:hypothetical protein THAOC_09388 [Thalassiosira oceanica]|uniref:DUF4461 domain-containing protein n=1 Tax=Thalassiosira oceanica TaxID=159749 RepID=K0SWN0_THAOC|nr:hypothetical protein THAOC_09388 [Thalassiosira oceanica]|mmetsp:Transcript_30431/g.68638  ORF Transcript_30431/g.68638 Transcript_30431/m.68638 type:complete len:481 (+) Transcript_30431:136-1578(+)|eukprot:EJK69369.1 hypothetical protein THAOC_09388 [Thalassiosira oceanica]